MLQRTCATCNRRPCWVGYMRKYYYYTSFIRSTSSILPSLLFFFLHTKKNLHFPSLILYQTIRENSINSNIWMLESIGESKPFAFNGIIEEGGYGSLSAKRLVLFLFEELYMSFFLSFRCLYPLLQTSIHMPRGLFLSKGTCSHYPLADRRCTLILSTRGIRSPLPELQRWIYRYFILGGSRRNIGYPTPSKAPRTLGSQIRDPSIPLLETSFGILRAPVILLHSESRLMRPLSSHYLDSSFFLSFSENDIWEPAGLNLKKKSYLFIEFLTFV